LINSHYPHFTATRLGSARKGFTAMGTPSSEVTVSICRVPSPEFSQAPWYTLPVYLSRFAVRSPMILATRFFLEAWNQSLCVLYRTRHHLSALTTWRICLPGPPTGLNRDIQHPDDLSFSVPPSLITYHRWCRNINLLSITYAFRPRLRDRLTLGRLTLPRKP
jgi:hypothetical protein